MGVTIGTSTRLEVILGTNVERWNWR